MWGGPPGPRGTPRSRNSKNDSSSPLTAHRQSRSASGLTTAHLSRIDLGCSLAHGAFEQLDIRNPDFPAPHIQVSDPDESLIFFMLRLLDRLRAMGTAPAADLMEYGRTLRSFRRT